MTYIKDKMREIRLGWFSRVKRMSLEAPVRGCEMIHLLDCRRAEDDLRNVRIR